MYIQCSDRKSVEAFVVGYECGASGECNFTELLSQNLKDKYKIKIYATGWMDQVERYSKKMSIDWTQAFHLLASEIVNEGLNEQKHKKEI